MAAKEQDPRSNRACRFPAHGLPVVAPVAALRGLLLPEGLLRVSDGPAQTMQSELPEGLARPVLPLACSQVPTLPLHAERLEPAMDVVVELVETPRGVARAEVLTPAPQHGVEVGDDTSEIRVTSRPRRQ